MKKIFRSLIVLFFLNLFSLIAANNPEVLPPNLSEGIESLPLQPLVNIIQPLLAKVNLLVGGIFGLYFFLILIRIYYERKKVHILKDIRYDLDYLNEHYKLPHSRNRQGPWGKTFRFISHFFSSKKNKSK